MKYILSFILLVMWIAGFVIAKGFWSTFFCIFAPYSFYLVIEKIMIMYNII